MALDPPLNVIEVVTVDGLNRKIADVQGALDGSKQGAIDAAAGANAARDGANTARDGANQAKAQLTAAVGQSLADNAQAAAAAQLVQLKAQATADYLSSLANLTGILAQLNVLSDAALITLGYSVGASADGQAQNFRADSSRSLGLRTNADGSVTVYGDPALFGVRTNADTSQTLYRSNP
jgi:hypothetical protein